MDESKEYNEINELVELIQNADITKWPFEDQLNAGLIFNEFVEKMKPFLIKNEVLNKDNPSPTTWLFKL